MSNCTVHFLQRFEQPTSPAPSHEIAGDTSNNLVTSTPGPLKSTIKPLHLSGVSEISSSESELGRNSV